VIAAIASLLTGPIRRPAAPAESVGADLAAVAADGGIEPSELVVPELASDRAPGDQGRANGQSAAIPDSGRNKPG
jgi:hypothetical protein